MCSLGKRLHVPPSSSSLFRVIQHVVLVWYDAFKEKEQGRRLTGGHEEGNPEAPRKNPAPQHLQVAPIERQGSADQHVQHHSQAPYVNLGPDVAFAFKHFRSSIWRTATPRRQVFRRGVEIAKSKISKFDVHITIQQ